MYNHMRITATMNTGDGRTLHIRKACLVRARAARRQTSRSECGNCLSTVHLDYPPIREEQVKLSYQIGSEICSVLGSL